MTCPNCIAGRHIVCERKRGGNCNCDTCAQIRKDAEDDLVDDDNDKDNDKDDNESNDNEVK